MTSLINVENLCVTFRTPTGPVAAVRGVTFEIEPGETVGLVGESGCGKSVTARSLMGLLSARHCRMEGEILYQGQNLVNLPEAQFRTLRGKEIAMVFQDPMSALNPTMKIGKQVQEALRKQDRDAALSLLEQVGIPDPPRRYHQYPHQLSGGMRQRVLVAMALACRPNILIADEPTTALDPELSEQILELLKQSGAALLLISHDIGLISRHADRTLVMYAGRLVEKGPTETVLSAPQHPYTQGLLASLPSQDTSQSLNPIPGAPPDLRCPPAGCAFSPRCAHAMRICSDYRPLLDRVGNGHRAACWLHDPRYSGC